MVRERQVRIPQTFAYQRGQGVLDFAPERRVFFLGGGGGGGGGEIIRAAAQCLVGSRGPQAAHETVAPCRCYCYMGYRGMLLLFADINILQHIMCNAGKSSQKLERDLVFFFWLRARVCAHRKEEGGGGGVDAAWLSSQAREAP